MAFDPNSEEEKDIHSAEDIITALESLIESEKAEASPESAVNAKILQEAVAKVKEFVGEEQIKESGVPAAPKEVVKPVVDTSILTGPIGGLRSFLQKRTADIDKSISGL